LLTRAQTPILGDLQAQRSDRALHDLHGGGHRRGGLLDSVPRVQGRVRRIRVDYLRGRHCELSLHISRGLEILLNPWYSQVLDGVIVVAALILNPTASRKRAAEASKPAAQMGEAQTTPSGGSEGLNPPGKSDLESGRRPIADKHLV
jgi:hypothetical protein